MCQVCVQIRMIESNCDVIGNAGSDQTNNLNECQCCMFIITTVKYLFHFPLNHFTILMCFIFSSSYYTFTLQHLFGSFYADSYFFLYTQHNEFRRQAPKPIKRDLQRPMKVTIKCNRYKKTLPNIKKMKKTFSFIHSAHREMHNALKLAIRTTEQSPLLTLTLQDLMEHSSISSDLIDHSVNRQPIRALIF